MKSENMISLQDNNKIIIIIIYKLTNLMKIEKENNIFMWEKMNRDVKINTKIVV